MNLFNDFILVVLFSIAASGAAFVLLSTKPARRLGDTFILSRAWADRLFLILVGAYFVTFSTLAIVRYQTFHAGYLGLDTSWDLGQYNQLIWNSLNGRLLEGTFVQDTATFLGKSFTPILLAFVPWYALFANPIVLLIVQVAGLALGGFPVYWFAREQLSPTLALVVALTYYLHPGLEHIGLTEFHEIALAVPIIGFAAFFLLRKHYAGLLICLLIALLVKEEMGLVAFIFGVYLFLFQRKRRLGLILAGSSLIWVALLIQQVIPFFRGAEYGQVFYYFGEGEIGGGGSRYSYLGRSIPEILMTFVTRPDLILAMVLIPEKVAFVLHLLVPFAFFPILGAEVLVLALPTLAYSLLSTYGLQYEIRSYYFSPLFPFLCFASILGIKRWLGWFEKRRSMNHFAMRGAMIVLLMTASLASYLLQSPGPLARHFQSYRYVIDEHSRLGNQLAAMIPNDAVVVAQNEFLAHLSNRRFLYEIPVIPDYRQADYVFADETKSWYDVHRPGWEGYRASGYFETLVERDGFWLAKRKSPDRALQIHFADQMTLLGYSIVPTNTLRGGTILRPILEWRADVALTERYTTAVRLVDARGRVWVEDAREPQEGRLPTPAWQVGKSIGDQYTLKMPPTMPAGTYHLEVNVSLNNGATLRDWVALPAFWIEKDKRSYTASELWIEQPLFVDMGELRFLGSKQLPRQLRAGEVLEVGLYWRARSQPRNDYQVAVELREESGRVIVSQANRPAQGTYPTREWSAGEVLLDWHEVMIPSSMARGTYRVVVVLRDAVTNASVGETLISILSVVD